MPAASILIKPASANCNMDCRYCFYKCLSHNREEYSKGFMKEETLEKLIRNAIDYADEYLAFAFQGGEPMLAGISFFEKAIALQKKYNTGEKKLKIENTLQTNAILIDDNWAKFFAQNNFLIGISLDGPRKEHDAARYDVNDRPTFERVMRAISILKKYNVAFNILTVIKNSTAGKASALYRFYKRNNFNYIQLIPCMDEENRQNGTESEYAVSPENYGKFLCDFFDLWYEDLKKGDIMDVRMFSNLAQMSVGFLPEECGMCGQCKCYFVVEGDGSIYPCDFYCMDDYKLGTADTSFHELIRSDLVRQFEQVSTHRAKECLNCEYYALCQGGCRRFREPFVEGKPGLNYLCNAYRLFFSHTYDRILRLGKTIIDPLARNFL